MDRDDLAELIGRGADRVLAIQTPVLEHFLVEPYADCLLWAIARAPPGDLHRRGDLDRADADAVSGRQGRGAG